MNIPPMVEILVSGVFLTIGAEILVRGASSLALRAGVSPLFVGLTIVGFGTSAPELSASMSSTLRGVPDISVGNVVGSSILNIAVILGFTAVIQPIPIAFGRIRRDILVAIAIGFVPLAGYLIWGNVSRSLGVLSVLGLVTYLYMAYRADRNASADEQQRALKEVSETLALKTDTRSLLKGVVSNLALIVAGLLMLVFGADRFVHGATEIAHAMGISDLIIGLTIVALGTSLPELATSMVAAYRNNVDVAVGNVLGSNIFNILGILGLCAVVAPQPLQMQSVMLDIPLMIGLSIVLYPLAKSGGRISRSEGVFLLTVYAVYVGVLAFGGLPQA